MADHNWQKPFDPSLIRQHNILVRVPTQAAESEFLAEVEALGCMWVSGMLPTDFSAWERYKEDVVIRVSQYGELSYAQTWWYDNEEARFGADTRCTFGLLQLDDVSISEAVTDLF